MSKRKASTAGESAAQQITQQFVERMQSLNYATEDPQVVSASIQQFTRDLTAALTPSVLANYVPCTSSEEFLSRCKAFGECITQAKDRESMWKAFDKLAGR
ncbi:MAG: hypothetical protein QME79_03925 [Bacillota bacterium]|nr:hypothetical protein [Bacillota bacterium]